MNQFTKILFVCIMLTITMSVNAQDKRDMFNPVNTSVTSQSIAPDARAAGMGDVGAATDPDVVSQYWNPAKFAFMESHGGIAANYTPWLRKLGVTDIHLAYVTGYYKWDDVQGISASFNYFSLGEVKLTDLNGTFLQDAHPNEWSLDVAYSRKLHEYVSMAVALRLLYSDMNAPSTGNGQPDLTRGITGAADVAVYYRQPIDLPMGTSHIAAGINISNLGGKMSFDNNATRNFIPANLRLGVSYELPFNEYNYMTFALEINKLLVPTRQSKYTEGYDKDDPSTWEMSSADYSKMSSVQGIFRSFADAPRGIGEEFQELQVGAGIEYTYNHQFFARFGYSHEDKTKGNRRYFTFGAGFKLSIFSLDASYVKSIQPSNPLDNTFRVSLGFDLAGIKDLVKN